MSGLSPLQRFAVSRIVRLAGTSIRRAINADRDSARGAAA